MKKFGMIHFCKLKIDQLLKKTMSNSSKLVFFKLCKDLFRV